jgi:acetyl esterase/lipase
MNNLLSMLRLSVLTIIIGLLLIPILQANGQTNGALTSLQRLERAHLQATHEARLRFERQRHPIPNHGVYEDFRAIMHAHAEDAEHTKGTRQELVVAARKDGIRVVLMTEHRGPKSDAWRGMHDGVLFIPGTETGDGTLVFPDYGADGKPIAGSGLRFLSHIEERYEADCDGMVGMEICNRHTDEKLDYELGSYLAAAAKDTNLWPALVENYHAFPDEFFGASPDYHQEIFAKWDKEVQKRLFAGIGANDAHQNVILNGVTFDPYEISFRNLVTHILAEDLTESSVRGALTNGHVYVAHDWLCDPSGFVFGARNNLGVFTMGDTAPMQGSTRVIALTPIAAKLRLVHNGSVVEETTGTNLTFQAKDPGAYRLEAWLSVDGEERPWIYSNPVYLKTFSPGDMRLPSTSGLADVEPHKGISYREGAEEDSAKHKLDVYSPKDKTNAPVLFFIHGGSWRSGDRALYGPLGNRYAHAGFVTVVPSYRLAPKHPHPAQIQDVAAAFAWTVRHVTEFGGDTNRIYVAGHSAGGHLAALLSLDESQLLPYQLSPKTIRGVLALSGVYDLASNESQDSVFGSDREVRRAASPLFHVNPGAPPFLVTYCQWDYFSLPAQAREFHRALQKAGVKAALVYIRGESHISEMVNISRADDPLAAAALKFMNEEGRL